MERKEACDPVAAALERASKRVAARAMAEEESKQSVGDSVRTDSISFFWGQALIPIVAKQETILEFWHSKK